jgi:hypothetical protein
MKIMKKRDSFKFSVMFRLRKANNEMASSYNILIQCGLCRRYVLTVLTDYLI